MFKLPKIRLAKRERLLLIGGIALLLLLIFFQLLSSGHKRMKTLERVNIKLEKELEEMYHLQSRYLTLEERLKSFDERMGTRPPDFTLFSHLDNLASQAGIKERIDYLKPEERVVSEKYRRSLVRVKLKGVTLEQLTRYLYSVESSPHSLKVRRLHITPKQGLLNVTFEVSTLLPRKI
ncbi:hypothetical protein ES703_13030 [subsurface metagenome]